MKIFFLNDIKKFEVCGIDVQYITNVSFKNLNQDLDKYLDPK